MSKNKRYFQLSTSGNVANLNIYGEITSFPWMESDVSAFNLSKQLADLQDVTQINVYINSYGGEVMEGLAIYNALRRHKAKVTTYCDGSACSIASVIFMAGDERIMCNPSFLMIHDAWTWCSGNAAELRKQADDLDTITSASVAAYMARINITEEKLRELMKAETWLTHDEAVEMGFATSIEESSESDKPSQSARKRLFELLMQAVNGADDDDDEEAAKKPSDAPDGSDEEDTDEGDEDDEKGAQKPKEASDEDDESEDAENDTEKEAAQMWDGFFNALYRVNKNRKDD